jgi:hypothetical protein
LDRHLHAWWQATLLIAAAYSIYAIGYNTPDSFVYLIPVWCVAALWLAAGLAWLLEAIARWLDRRLDRPTESALTVQDDATAGRVTIPAILGAILIILLLALPAFSAARFWRENDLSYDREARDFVTHALADAAPDAIVLTSSDGPTFALWYALYGLGQRPDMAPVNVNLVSFDWYRRTLAGRHPDLAAALSVFDPARPTTWLAAVAAERPLYRAEPLAVPLPGYDAQPAGSLVRLIRHPNE